MSEYSSEEEDSQAPKSGFAAYMSDSDEDEDDDEGDEPPAPAPQPPSKTATSTSSGKKGSESGVNSTSGGSGKKGKKNKQKKKQEEEEEDEWELLEKLAPQTDTAEQDKKDSAKDKEDTNGKQQQQNDEKEDPESSANAYLAQLGIEDNSGGGSSKKKKKSGKKKGKGGKQENKQETSGAAAEEEDSAKPKSAVAKLAQERKAKAKAEEERRKKEEEERKRQEEEEKKRLEEERKRIEEEKERKKEEKRKEIERQKKEGTYLTKAQRRKAQEAQNRFEAMKAAGMHVPSSGESAQASSSAENKLEDEKQKEIELRKKKQQQKKLQEEKEKEEQERMKEEARKQMEQEQANAAEQPMADSWEDLLDNVEEVPSVPQVSVSSAAGAWDDDDEAEKEKLYDSLATALKGPKHKAQPKVDKNTMSLEERIELSRENRKKRLEEAKQNRSSDKLRSPICCVMGHVDTGKTKILDRIRKTHVQEGEAGGITQQIGSTWFPIDNLRKSTDKLQDQLEIEYKVPGLLVIDTPGHEAFTNLRSRGSSLCDIAILVVDIMHGLEPQTKESLNMLRESKTPFVVALNKIDRCYGWKSEQNQAFRTTLANQPQHTQEEFNRRAKDIMFEFQAEGLNAYLYYENTNFKNNVSIVPTSAMTGEGIPDLLMLMIKLTQQLMGKRMMYMDFPMGTVLEVNTFEGLGSTIDVVLVNGALNEGDNIVVCGMNGPIVAPVRALLTPAEGKEIRVKSDFARHSRVEAAKGVKIASHGHTLEKAIAGTQLFVLDSEDEEEQLKEEVMKDYEELMENMHRDSIGVFVQASTLGSLEALIHHLKTMDPPIPVAGVNLGTVHKKNVKEACAMLERKPEYAVILAFDVKISAEARQYAEENGIKIFSADIIYHLTDEFTNHIEQVREEKQKSLSDLAVFPAACKIVKIFNNRNPLVLGVEVVAGKLRIETPLCVIAGETPEGMPMVLDLGRVTSMEHEHKPVEQCAAGDPPVAARIEPMNEDQRAVQAGRHFTEKHMLYSHISRETIDCVKENFRDVMAKEDWLCMKKLKDVFKIP
eukprot:gb/GECG01004822.1/.p1 GENE.gb/GECG01004822.1/~~gb/GECG01004822.1/.p1  ORF type:complete len:1051 (+),score=276.13 gb/GECG01004822.1/:1-3153(+)